MVLLSPDVTAFAQHVSGTVSSSCFNSSSSSSFEGVSGFWKQPNKQKSWLGNPSDQGESFIWARNKVSLHSVSWSTSPGQCPTVRCVVLKLALCLHKLQRKGKQAWGKGRVTTTDQVSLENRLFIVLFKIAGTLPLTYAHPLSLYPAHVVLAPKQLPPSHTLLFTSENFGFHPNPYKAGSNPGEESCFVLSCIPST